MTECTQESFDFPACKRRRVEAAIDGGDINDPVLVPLARAFSTAVLLHSAAPPGSLRAPAGESETVIEAAPFDGLVIGRANLPLVFEGEAVFHLAHNHQTSLLEQHLDAMQDGSTITSPEMIEEPPIA